MRARRASFPAGVASVRQSGSCCLQDRLRHDFWGIAFFHAFQHELFDMSARRRSKAVLRDEGP
jgi:hypothetical protein